MEFTVTNLEYAVSVFYNSEHEERTQAHQWLTAAQRCPEAWGFVWELLQPQKGTEIQFFAATTLHTKLLRCWHEVPPNDYEELRNKILHAVLTYANGPKIVLNRLCISLAAFILQQGGSDIAAVLQPLSSFGNTYLLMEVLTVIPEEFNSMTMGATLRGKTRVALQQACPAVLDDMLQYLRTAFEERSVPPSEEQLQVWCKASTCAGSWLALGGVDGSLDASIRTGFEECMPLCHALLQVVHVIYSSSGEGEAVSGMALEACEACLGAVRGVGAAAEGARYPTAAAALLRALAALARPILARHDTPNSQHEDLLSALFTCLVAISENHISTLVSGDPGLSKEIVDLILACQGAPGHYPLHETRSQLAFGFWYMLQDEVLREGDATAAALAQWRQVFRQLLVVLARKAEAPAHHPLPLDDAELFRCYRQDIADTALYCVGVLGDECWSLVEGAWERGGAGEGRAGWVAREAALGVLAALGEAAPPARPLPALARLYRRAAASCDHQHAPLARTALECVGTLASWVGSVEGAEAGEMAREALAAAAAALQRHPRAAALALRKLCTECARHVAPLAPTVAALTQRCVEGLEEGGGGGGGGGGACEEWVVCQLAAGAGAVLAQAPHELAAPPARELAAALHRGILAQAKSEMAAGESGRGEHKARRREAAGGACAVAGWLMRGLSTSLELSGALLAHLLPALPPLATQPKHFPAMFQFLKQAISALLDECLPMLDDMQELVTRAFNTEPCVEGVEVLRLMVLAFEERCVEAVAACVWATAAHCAGGGPAVCDLSEALFDTLLAITKKRPQLLRPLEPCMTHLVQLGCQVVGGAEAGAARVACAWLAALALQAPAHLLTHAPPLAHKLIALIGGGTPRSEVEPLVGLLLALNRAAWPVPALGSSGPRGGLALWLRESLAKPDFPSPHATQQHKDKFINSVIKEKISKRRLMESVQEFSLVCRGLVGTEYARQAIATSQLLA